jgi:hypothetical protein
MTQAPEGRQMAIEPDDVSSRRDLATFVADLQINLEEHPEEWENANLGRFLDALSRYLDGLDGWCRNNAPHVDPEKASWRLFATALAGAKVYE